MEVLRQSSVHSEFGLFSQSQPIDLSSCIVSDQSISASTDMEDDGVGNNFNTVHAVTSTPVSTRGQNLNYTSSISEIDSFNLTDQAGIADIQIDSIDSSSDNSLIDTSTGLKILYTNIDSYLNKREEFQWAIDNVDPDIICMVEILPKVKIPFNQYEYVIGGYRSFFSNTEKRGAVIMVKDQLISNSYEKLTSHSFEESVWAVVQLEGRDKLLIGCIYRSPNADDYNNTQMLHMLERAADENFSHILIVTNTNTLFDIARFRIKVYHQRRFTMCIMQALK